MLITVALALAIASVPLLGGSLARLADLEFRHGWIALLALGLQVLVIEVVPEGDDATLRAAHLVSYGMLFVWAGLNVDRIPYLWLIAVGGISNAIAIFANDGVMPALPGALAYSGIESTPGEFSNSTAVDDPKLQFLGDVLATPPGLGPLSGVFSVGDVLLLAGVTLCLHATCRRNVGATLARLAWPV